MDIKKTILCFLMFLLFISFSYALEDFNGYLNTQSIEICKCSDYQDSITIENIGDEFSSYGIVLQGELKEKTKLSRQAFSLAPGEKIDVNYAVSDSCGLGESYELIFDITPVSGIAKRMAVPVLIKKCQNIELTTKKNTIAICPCSQVKYQLELKNPGDFSETYSIDVSKPFEKWSKLTVKEIILAAGQKTTLDFYLRPGCEVYGNYSSVFKVTSKKTKLTAKMPLHLFISPCYEFNITLGDYYFDKEENISLFKERKGTYDLCEKKPKTMPILIENNAPIPNRFDINFKGEDWLNLEGERVIVKARNSTIIDLIAEPPEKLNENYTFSIEVETYWGDLKQTKEFNVSVRWCYPPFIETKRLNINYTQSINKITVQNQGTNNAKYYFNIMEKPDWISIGPENITINSHKNKSIEIVSEPSEDIKQGKYNLIINTTAGKTGPGYEHSIVIKLDKKGFIGKSYDYLKEKIAFAYGKTKEYLISYTWYLLGGLAGLIVLLILVSLARKAVKRRKKPKPKLPAEKEKKEIKKAEKELKKKEKIKINFHFILKIILLVLAVAVLGYAVFYFRIYIPYFIWYVIAGLSVLILAVLIILALRSKKTRKHFKKNWWIYILCLIIIAALFLLSYNIMPGMMEGNFSTDFTAITAYSGNLFGAGEQDNVTESAEVHEVAEVPEVVEIQEITEVPEEPAAELVNVSEETPPAWADLKEKLFSCGNFLKQYSYYIGFAILALVLLFLLIRFAARGKKEDIEAKYVEIKKQPKEKKQKEIKKAEKKAKKDIDYHFILKVLLWVLVIFALIFAMSYFKNYVIFFIWYIFAGLFALTLIIYLLKSKSIKKHFKKRWKLYLLFLILLVIFFGVYFCYQNKYYERPYIATKTWALSFIAGFYVSDAETAEPEELKEEEIESEEKPEEEIIEEEPEEQIEEIIEEEVEEEITEEKGFIISWEQDSNYVLDLNEYFQDPDNDKLYFRSSRLDNILVDIDDDGLAALKPNDGWHGSEKVVFTADDGKGGIIKSEGINLVVKETGEIVFDGQKDAGFIAKSKNLLIDYLYYIIAGFVILFIAFFFLRDKKEEKNKSNKNNKRKK